MTDTNQPMNLYEETHRHPVNRVLHAVGIPLLAGSGIAAVLGDRGFSVYPGEPPWSGSPLDRRSCSLAMRSKETGPPSSLPAVRSRRLFDGGSAESPASRDVCCRGEPL